ncbi:patellin-4-like [Juglans microcarpa x Juglans regia]|uniref:patellin-4-like n=1 Tax=Juglans microcarpa x Juglans regia TaxID=2249226 RepID=UPI001B7E6FA3|nr:patellin-4-like [Juglans microcarpa x Juglans regia]
MAKTTEVDGKQEQKPSKNVENEDVIVAKVEGVEQNGESKEDNVQKMEVVIDNGKNVHELTAKKVEEKESKAERKDMSLSPVAEKNTSPREESNFLSHLKVHEKKAFAKLKMKIDEVIKGKLWIHENKNNVDETVEKKKKDEAERSDVNSQPPPTVDRSSSFTDMSNFPSDWKEYEKKALAELRAKVEESINGNHLFKAKNEQMDLQENAKSLKKVRKEIREKKEEKSEENEKLVLEGKEKEDADKNGAKESKESKQDKTHLPIEEENLNVDKDIALWGIPLLPSKGDNATDIILLKFLKAREFKVNDAFEMLRNTLQWRKENNIDSILKESIDSTELDMMCYMNGLDRQGHPVCYNNFGLLGDNEMYNKMLGTEEKREKFLRWRVQLMEKGIQRLDFKPGGVSSLLQISNLRNTSGPSKKELWCSIKQVVGLLQDNYPEFVEKNIFINVPFWFYAFTALLSPFLTQQTRSKFVFARPSKVTETLLKYIPAEEIPVHCGGLKQENDSEFSNEDAVMEVVVKAGSTETINIPVSEAGTTLIWELCVTGWEVNYKEEFEPSHEGSYSIIVQRDRKMGVQEGPVRNSFKNKEPGKVMLIVQNVSFKKKRVLYRHKIKKISSST